MAAKGNVTSLHAPGGGCPKQIPIMRCQSVLSPNKTMPIPQLEMRNDDKSVFSREVTGNYSFGINDTQERNREIMVCNCFLLNNNRPAIII